MACQTGIRSNEKLRSAFQLGKQEKLRLIKVVVRNEELTSNYEYRGTGDWRADWRASLPDCIDAFEPCFVLFRLGSSRQWMFITFADDGAPVKEKMLLAATRATFKDEFGPSFIEHERHVTDRRDLTLDATEAWLTARRQPDLPMTVVEQELAHAAQERARLVAQSAASGQSSGAGLRGVWFPVDGDAQNALRRLAARQLQFVQLSVDTLNEAIKLETVEAALDAAQLRARIPADKPRYQFYRFDYNHEGADRSEIVFLYSLPTSQSSIKERMLYSSCKGPFLQHVTNDLGVNAAKRIEVDGREKLDATTLLDYLHPGAATVGMASERSFQRPAPPGRPRTTLRT